MLKSSGITKSKTRLAEGRVGVGVSSRAGQDGSESWIDNNEVNGNEIGDNEVEKKV